MMINKWGTGQQMDACAVRRRFYFKEQAGMYIEKIDRSYIYRFSKDELAGFVKQETLGELVSGEDYQDRFTDGELRAFISDYGAMQWISPDSDDHINGIQRYAHGTSFAEAGYEFPDAEGISYFVGSVIAAEEWDGFRKVYEDPGFDGEKFDSYIVSTYRDKLTAMIIERIKADIREEIEELMDGPGMPGGVPYETFRDKVLTDIETMRDQGNIAISEKYAAIEEDEGAARVQVAREVKVNVNNFKRLMHERGVGISRLEAYIGAEPGTISKTLDGEYISAFDAINLSLALHTTPEKIIDGMDERQPVKPWSFEYDEDDMEIVEEAEYELEL
jgi:hypothetical protein